MKFINALFTSMKKTDNTSMEHLEKNIVRSNLEELCDTYLNGNDAILEFEALPKALPHVVSVLEEKEFLERYEFQQVSDSLFDIRERELNIL